MPSAAPRVRPVAGPRACFDPRARAASISAVQTVGSALGCPCRASPALLPGVAPGTVTGVVTFVPDITSPPSCPPSLPPLLPQALPGFNATMRALTPARGCGFRSVRTSTLTPRDRPRGSLRFTTGSSPVAGSPHLPGSPTPITSPLPPIALPPVLSASRASRSSRVRASPFHRWLAGRHGRNEFVILRIARSPRVAPLYPSIRFAAQPR